MARSSTIDFGDMERDNWNIADKYTTFVIFAHINNLNNYERIAKFGVGEFDQQFQVPEENKGQVRINALRWFMNELEMLIRNTIFAIKYDKNKEQMEIFKKKIKDLRPFIQNIEQVQIDQRTSKRFVRVEEKSFSQIMNILVQIKEEVLPILNKSDLIFKHYDEFDPIKQKQEIIDELIRTGG